MGNTWLVLWKPLYSCINYRYLVDVVVFTKDDPDVKVTVWKSLLLVDSTVNLFPRLASQIASGSLCSPTGWFAVHHEYGLRASSSPVKCHLHWSSFHSPQYPNNYRHRRFQIGINHRRWKFRFSIIEIYNIAFSNPV